MSPAADWRGHGTGCATKGGRIARCRALYPAYRPTDGTGYLDEILLPARNGAGPPARHSCWSTSTTCTSEPGRSLVDQCGHVARPRNWTYGSPDTDAGRYLVHLA
ncbi:hypothetical protein GCM10023238_09080 [Streptomyces heliomycini]